MKKNQNISQHRGVLILHLFQAAKSSRRYCCPFRIAQEKPVLLQKLQAVQEDFITAVFSKTNS